MSEYTVPEVLEWDVDSVAGWMKVSGFSNKLIDLFRGIHARKLGPARQRAGGIAGTHNAVPQHLPALVPLPSRLLPRHSGCSHACSTTRRSLAC